jgi:DNA-directed RNA polymerase delta subunit
LSLGTADKSFGEVGREGWCVRESVDVDVSDEQVDDPEEKAERKDERDEDLLRAREKTDEVYDAFEKIESVGDGNVAESGVIPGEGTWTSFRMAIKRK